MAAKTALLPDILEENLEEAQFLWNLRQRALRSPDYTLRPLVELDSRIESHLFGLMIARESLLPLVEDKLADANPCVAFVAAYPLLRIETEACVGRVLTALKETQEPGLAGLRQAFCYAPNPPLKEVRSLLDSGPPPAQTAATLEILAFHRKLDLRATDWDRFLKHANPAIRQAAWRSLHFIGQRPPATYQAGLQEEEPTVLKEVLLALAWGRQSNLLEYCQRNAAARPDCLMLLAVLGKPQDLPRFLTMGKAEDMGPRRFHLLGAYGHPGVMELVLRGLDNPDPRTAVAAAAAFTRMTGVAIDSDKRVQLPPEDGHEPDEFEREFLDEVKLPDAQKAKDHWAKVKGDFAKGTRWAQGVNVGQKPTPEVLNQLDLESRWEACLRGKFEGTWPGKPQDLEAFPQKS